MGVLISIDVPEGLMSDLLDFFKILNNLTFLMYFLHSFKVLLTLSFLVEEAGVSIPVFQPFTMRFLPPPLQFLSACYVEVHLQLSLSLNITIDHSFVLHAGLMDL